MTGQLADLPDYYNWAEELTETRNMIQVSEWDVEAGKGTVGHTGAPKLSPSVLVSHSPTFTVLSCSPATHHGVCERAEVSVSGKGGSCEE